ncbi:MAG: surface lipoprotein assembly modifier [Hyphomicrobiaceae bacterium]
MVSAAAANPVMSVCVIRVDAKRRWVAQFALSLALFLGSACAPALAADPSPPAQSAPPQGWSAVSVEDLKQRWPKLALEHKVLAIDQLIKIGEFDLAGAYLAALKPTQPVAALDVRFLFGSLRKAQGRLPEAIDIFRDVLARHPGHVRARFELAQSLFLAQQDESARHHFDLVRGSLTNTGLDRVVQGYVDAMDQRRRWNASAYFSIAPSTNLNQGTDSKTVSLNGLDFTIDDHATKKSGVGAVTGFNAGYRQPLTDRLDLVIGGGANIRQYDQDVFNDYVATGELGPRYRFDWGDIGLYATGSRRWHSRDEYQLGTARASGHHFGADPYAVFLGGRFAINARFGPQDIASGNFACLEKRFDTFVWQNGENCAVQVSWDHFLDSTTFIRVLGGSEIERTRTAHANFIAANAGFGAYHEFGWGMTFYGQAMYTRREFDGIYPATTTAREDDRLDLTLMVTKRDWTIFGLAPSIQYTYSLLNSNVAAAAFDAHGATFTFTKKF